MKKHRITSIPLHLTETNLEELNDLFEEIIPRQNRSELQRWRKLKHQLA